MAKNFPGHHRLKFIICNLKRYVKYLTYFHVKKFEPSLMCSFHVMYEYKMVLFLPASCCFKKSKVFPKDSVTSSGNIDKTIAQCNLGGRESTIDFLILLSCSPPFSPVTLIKKKVRRKEKRTKEKHRVRKKKEEEEEEEEIITRLMDRVAKRFRLRRRDNRR